MTDTRDFRGQSRAKRNKEVIESTGRFKYDHPLDQRGGIKGVYIVKDNKDGLTKALKILWGSNLSRQRVENEWNLWKEINAHNGDTTHIVRIIEPPIKLGSVYGVLMEQAIDSLEGLINDPIGIENNNNNKLTPTNALRYVKETALAMKEVHAIGMSHSDLKPSNILLFEIPDSNRLYVKVGDFANSTQSSHPTSSEKGSHGYMAPEAEKISKDSKCLYTPKSDIYSLGVILFQLLHPNSETPFDELQGQVLYKTQLQKDQKYIRNKLKEIKGDEKLKPIILKCLHPDLAERYDSIDDFISALSSKKSVITTVNDEKGELKEDYKRSQGQTRKYEPKPKSAPKQVIAQKPIPTYSPKPKPIIVPTPQPTIPSPENHTVRNLVYTAVGIGLISLLSYAGCQGCSNKNSSSSSSYTPSRNSSSSSSSGTRYSTPQKKRIDHLNGYSIIEYSSPQELAEKTQQIKEKDDRIIAENRRKQEEQRVYRSNNSTSLDKNLREATRRGEEYQRRIQTDPAARAQHQKTTRYQDTLQQIINADAQLPRNQRRSLHEQITEAKKQAGM